MLAVLGRHAGIGAGSADVFVNVAGGVRVDEPGADLAVALAVASAVRGVTMGERTPLACFGEVGLTGELRSVGHADRRLAEAAKFGLAPVLGAGRADADAAGGGARGARCTDFPRSSLRAFRQGAFLALLRGILGLNSA